MIQQSFLQFQIEREEFSGNVASERRDGEAEIEPAETDQGSLLHVVSAHALGSSESAGSECTTLSEKFQHCKV
jgi:hypothetical protein